MLTGNFIFSWKSLFGIKEKSVNTQIDQVKLKQTPVASRTIAPIGTIVATIKPTPTIIASRTIVPTLTLSPTPRCNPACDWCTQKCMNGVCVASGKDKCDDGRCVDNRLTCDCAQTCDACTQACVSNQCIPSGNTKCADGRITMMVAAIKTVKIVIGAHKNVKTVPVSIFLPGIGVMGYV